MSRIILIPIDNDSHLDQIEPRSTLEVLKSRNVAMYVCICHAVTDRQIREVVDEGATNLVAVQQVLPVASCCG